MADLPLPRKSTASLAIPSEQPFDLKSSQKVTISDQISSRDIPLSVGEWLLTLIVLAIPLFNVVLYIYWACCSKGNQSRINFSRAVIILFVFSILIRALSELA